MPKNIELKAYCENMAVAAQTCHDLGATSGGPWEQTDTYFNVQAGRLKLRRTSNGTDELISYVRHDEAKSRLSQYERLVLSPTDADKLSNMLGQTLGSFAHVIKNRSRFTCTEWLVNLDFLDGIGNFIEFEVFADNGEDHVAEILELLRHSFKIRDSQILPWSYSQICAMYARSKSARAELGAATGAGTLYLIDGCSGSGKSTVIEKLQSTLPTHYTFTRRFSTRKPRQKSDDEYLFVSQQEFAVMKQRGEFIDCKDFLFGMSYGLAWSSVLSQILIGKSVIAPMNWGNALHVKRLFPEAKIIGLRVSEATIRQRLLARGIHRDEEIEERLGNAKRFDDSDVPYDLVVTNETGLLNQAVAQISEYVKCLR